MNGKSTITGLIATVMVLLCSPAKSQDGVYFAGVAFTGSNSDIVSIAPYSSMLITEQRSAEINELLRQAISNFARLDLLVADESLAQINGTTSQKALAISIDSDQVVEERIVSDYKYLYEISAQILVYDYATGLIAESIPMNVQHVEIAPAHISHDHKLNVIESLLFDVSLESSLVNQLTVAASNINFEEASKRLQIGEVDTSGATFGLDETAEQTALGHEMTKILFDNIEQGILPYANGNAIGEKMPRQFADGRIYQFEIPSADYLLDVHIDRTVISEVSTNTLLLGAYLTLKIYQPHSGSEYVNASFKFGTTKTIPRGSEVDQIALEQEVILQAFDKFLGSTKNIDRDWLNAQQDPRATRKQIDNLSDFTRSLN